MIGHFSIALYDKSTSARRACFILSNIGQGSYGYSAPRFVLGDPGVCRFSLPHYSQ